GVNGVSQKAAGAGHASHYYSLTRLETSGNLRLGSATFTASGDSWMDHEFGTNQLTESQTGWDWFSIQLDNGTDIMIYRMRSRDGGDSYSSGTLVDENSKTYHLSWSEFAARSIRQWKSQNTGTLYPIEWMITLPAHHAELHLTPVLDNQELATTRSTGVIYWE